MLQRYLKHRSLDLIQPGVDTGEFVDVLPGAAVVAHHFKLLGQLRIGGDHSAAVAQGAAGLGGIEAETADGATISLENFKNFFYGKSEECRLSTVIKLARLFNLSIDEIVGAGTVSEELEEYINMYTGD